MSSWEIRTPHDCNEMIRTDTLSGATSIATIGYADLEYEDVPSGYVTSLTREGLMLEILQRLRDGQVWVPLCYLLTDCALLSHVDSHVRSLQYPYGR